MRYNKLTRILGIGAITLGGLEALIGCSYVSRGGQETNVKAKRYDFETLDKIYKRIDSASGYTDKDKVMLKSWYKDLMGREFTQEEKELIKTFDQYAKGPRKKEFEKRLEKLGIQYYVDLNNITEIDKVIIMKINEEVGRALMWSM